MVNVIVVVGAGLIGQAIVRRVAAGRHVLLADLKLKNAEAAAQSQEQTVDVVRDQDGLDFAALFIRQNLASATHE